MPFLEFQHVSKVYHNSTKVLKYGKVTIPTEYPCTVEDRYIMNPSSIPKFDNPKLHQSECLYLFGAGREKKIYAVPPHTDVVSLAFEDMPFEREDFKGKNAVSAAAPTLIWMKCSMQRPEKNFISVQILLTARRCVPVKTVDSSRIFALFQNWLPQGWMAWN